MSCVHVSSERHTHKCTYFCRMRRWWYFSFVLSMGFNINCPQWLEEIVKARGSVTSLLDHGLWRILNNIFCWRIPHEHNWSHYHWSFCSHLIMVTTVSFNTFDNGERQCCDYLRQYALCYSQSSVILKKWHCTYIVLIQLLQISNKILL